MFLILRYVQVLCPVPYSLCPVPYSLCPVPISLCPVPIRLCPVPISLCPVPISLCPVPISLCPVPIRLCPVPISLCPVPYSFALDNTFQMGDVRLYSVECQMCLIMFHERIMFYRTQVAGLSTQIGGFDFRSAHAWFVSPTLAVGRLTNEHFRILSAVSCHHAP
jgi:hypothetical protein